MNIQTFVCSSLGAIALGLVLACVPGVTPSSAADQIFAKVKADVIAGDTAPQLEADVAAILKTDVSPVVDTIIDATLTVLEAAHEISTFVGESDVHKQIRAKLPPK